MMKKTFLHTHSACVFSLSSLAFAPTVAQTFDPVVISASRIEKPRSESSVIVDVVSRGQIEQSGASNIVEFLDTLPGVSANRLYGRAGVDATIDIGYMGESGSQNVLVLIDGQRINALDSSNVRFAQIPMSSIERVEIRKANGGALFGDRAQGGVINIITRETPTQDVSATLGNEGYQKYETYLGFKTDDLRGGVSAMHARSDGWRDSSDSEQNSAQLKASIHSEWGKIAWLGRAFEETGHLPWGLTASQYAQNPKQSVNSSAMKRKGASLGFKYEYMVQAADRFTLDVIHQDTESESYPGVLKNRRLSWNPEYAIERGPNQWLLGAEMTKAQANTDSGKQVAQHSQSAYAQWIHTLSKAIAWDAAWRSQQVDNDFKTQAEAAKTQSSDRKNAFSLGVKAQMSEDTTMRLGALSGYRLPNADELYYFDQNTYQMLEINPNIKPMATREWFIQMGRHGEALDLQAHWRNIKAKNEIAYRFDCGLVAGVNASCNANQFDTSRSVLSFSANWKVTRQLTVDTSADFIDAKLDSGDNPGQPVPLTPKHVLRLGAEQRFDQGAVMLQTHHRSHMRQASDVSGYYPLMPSRTLVDLGFKTALAPAITASIWLRNLFNTTYYDFATYGAVYPADGRSVFLTVKAAH